MGMDIAERSATQVDGDVRLTIARMGFPVPCSENFTECAKFLVKENDKLKCEYAHP